MDPIKILIFEESRNTWEGGIGLFKSQPNIHIVGKAVSVHEAINQIEQFNPDFVVAALNLSEGVETEKKHAVLAYKVETNLVFLTVNENAENLWVALQAEANGCASYTECVSNHKPEVKPRLDKSSSIQGNPFLSRQTMLELMAKLAKRCSGNHQPSQMLKRLSPRELDVLNQLIQGKTNRTIASHLLLSENTVKHYVRNILDKLELKSRQEVATFVKYHGLSLPIIPPN